MSKFKELKEFAIAIKNFLVVLAKFSINKKTLLATRHFSPEEISKIKETYTIRTNFKGTVEEDTFFIKRLGVESFYCNHNLFFKIFPDYNASEFLEAMKEPVWNGDLNLTSENINVDVLEKAHKNNPFCDKILHAIYLNATHNLNPTLYRWVEQLVDYSDEDFTKCILSALLKKGSLIKKNSYLYHELLFRFPLNERNFCIIKEHYSFSKKQLNNLFDFYNVPLKHFDFSIEQLPDNFWQQHLSIKTPTKEELIRYLEHSFEENKMYARINFLKRNNLLQEWIFEIPMVCKNIFKQKERYRRILTKEQIANTEENYKIHLLKYPNLEELIFFLRNHTQRLDIKEVASIIANPSYEDYSYTFQTSLFEESIKIAQNKYSAIDSEQFISSFFHLKPDESNQFIAESNISISSCDYRSNSIKNAEEVVNLLLKLYPYHINNQSFLMEVAKQSSSDLMLSTYARQFFKNNNNRALKDNFVHFINIFDSHAFGAPLTFSWIVEEHLVHMLLKDKTGVFTNKAFNVWVPLLIEKYGLSPNETIHKTVYSYLSNDSLFKYILNSYPLDEKTEQKLCNSVYSICNIELATELASKGIAPNDYFVEKFESQPNAAGTILIKSHIKNNLEQEFAEKAQHSTKKNNKPLKV